MTPDQPNPRRRVFDPAQTFRPSAKKPGEWEQVPGGFRGTVKHSTALFGSCVECGSNRPNHSDVCPTCETKHGYADRPFSDDVQPSHREPAQKETP